MYYIVILDPILYTVGLTVAVCDIVGRCFSAVCSGRYLRRVSKSNYKNALPVVTAAGNKAVFFSSTCQGLTHKGARILGFLVQISLNLMIFRGVVTDIFRIGFNHLPVF